MLKCKARNFRRRDSMLKQLVPLIWMIQLKRGGSSRSERCCSIERTKNQRISKIKKKKENVVTSEKTTTEKSRHRRVLVMVDASDYTVRLQVHKGVRIYNPIWHYTEWWLNRRRCQGTASQKRLGFIYSKNSLLGWGSGKAAGCPFVQEGHTCRKTWSWSVNFPPATTGRAYIYIRMVAVTALTTLP